MQRPFGQIFLLIQLAVFVLAGSSPDKSLAGNTPPVPKEEIIADFEARLLLARFLGAEEVGLPEAANEYLLLVKEAGEDVTVRRELADVLLRMGKPREAKQHLDTAFKIAPADDNLRLSMAGVESALGHVTQARKLATDVCGSKMFSTPKLSCATLLLSWGDFYEAEAIARRYLAANPHDLTGRLLWADILVGSQRFTEAEGVIQLLLLDFPTVPELYARLATIRILAKDFSGALVVIDQTPLSIAAAPSLLMAAGQANLEAQRYTEAEKYFARAAHPSSPLRDSALLGLARVYRNLGREKECDSLLRELLARNPDQIETQYLATGRERVTSAAFLDSLGIAPASTPEALSQWGRLFAADGQIAEAIACYEAALAKDRDFFTARLEKAQLLAANEQYDASLSELADLARELPSNPKVLLARARILGWAKQYEEAILAYDGLISLNPTDPSLRFEQARTAIWGKDPATAARIYISLWSEPVDAQLASALTDFPAMREEMQKYDDDALPWDAYERFNLQLAPAGSMRTPEEASMERLRLRLLPIYRIQKTAFLERRAKELSWDKRLARAMDTQAELIGFAPGNQEARFDYAQSQCALGLCDGAEETYEELLAISPLHNLAALALARQQRQNNPALSVQHNFWQEKGRGDLADITRQQADLTLELPLLGRSRLEVIGHRWKEDAGNSAASIDANGFGLRIFGVANRNLRGSFELHQKHYEEDGLADLTSGAGELWFNLDDTLRLGLGLERRDELANRFGLAQGIQADHRWLSLVAPLTRSLELAGRTEALDYSDDNKGSISSLSLGYAFTDHPRLFKTSLKGEVRDTNAPSVSLYQGDQLVYIVHPYWTPENYTAGTLEFEWLHDLSLRQFCGNKQHSYNLKLGLITDSDNNPAVRLEGKYLYEFAEHWRFELRGLVHSSQEWDALGISGGIQYRF